MSSSGSQFLLLLWKNFVLQKRKKCVTAFEIIVPLFFALLLLLIRVVSDSEFVKTDTTWNSFGMETPVTQSGRTRILYAPSNTHTDTLMSAMVTDMNSTGSVGKY